MKHIFIINNFSGNKKINNMIDNIDRVCKEKDIDYVIEYNDLERSTEDILKKYSKSKNIIYAVGGDGMINRILNGIVGTKNILGIIPCGTGNDFYKTLCECSNDKIMKSDIVKINNKYFINTACFGIDADVANNTGIIKSKLIPKALRYIISLIYTFVGYKNREFEVEINGEKISDKFSTIAICNGRYYGNGFNIGVGSNINDGKLEVYIARDLSKLLMVKLILKIKKGKHINDRNVSRYDITKMCIKSKVKIKSNIDGEELEDKKFDIEIIKDGIEVYFDKDLIDKIVV